MHIHPSTPAQIRQFSKQSRDVRVGLVPLVVSGHLVWIFA
jgi:hypothetical protein